ncbi:LysE family transporter [Acinetobacter sp. WZC-1]|uniref:LysE family transporter n=1 Tax=Acinetobacter sp. WZC-1 TaxID=3459034 RepID=UPI00403DA2EE
MSLLHFVAQLSPGPDVLLVARSAASTTRTNTLKIILGISVGVIVWVALTLLGFNVLMKQWPWLQQLLMLAGGFLLAKMGYAMLKGGILLLKQNVVLDGRVEQRSGSYFLWGLFTNLSNPKMLIYFSSVFSLALSAATDKNLTLLLAIIIPVQSFVVFTLLMLMLSIPRVKACYQRMGSYIDIIAGLLFLFFAVFLWLAAIDLF